LRGPDHSLDLVFSSFAVHHLSAVEKGRLFQEVHRRLKLGGFFLMVDTARNEEEDRPTYLEHYCGWIESDWQGVAREGLDHIYDHIRNNDFPETNSTLHALAAKAGFARTVEVDKFLWHRTWRFETA
ncbi:MAG TPA: class I SAM-dependent methyltransferase, partial [Verrucomicrobiales bacterium]|nr:class I SAM-dependent methyltransferase [Verrucomicrobiales bacterium]